MWLQSCSATIQTINPCLVISTYLEGSVFCNIDSKKLKCWKKQQQYKCHNLPCRISFKALKSFSQPIINQQNLARMCDRKTKKTKQACQLLRSHQKKKRTAGWKQWTSLFSSFHKQGWSNIQNKDMRITPGSFVNSAGVLLCQFSRESRLFTNEPSSHTRLVILPCTLKP